MISETSEANDLLTTLNTYLSRLIPAVQECAGHYQSGQINDGSNLLLNIVEGLSWVIKAAAGAQMQGVEIEDINTKFNEIVQAFENEDYVLVGDLLEYEISPVLQGLLAKTSSLITEFNH